jgi:hypothetical protein
MVFKFSSRAALALLSAVLAAPVFAHHSASMLDLDKEVVLNGTVREVQWTNPHIWIQLVVKDKSGKDVEWSIEGASPRLLKRVGIERTTIKPGDKVALTISPLRSGKTGGGFVRVVLPNGEMRGLPVGKKFDYVNPGADPAKGLLPRG